MRVIVVYRDKGLKVDNMPLGFVINHQTDNFVHDHFNNRFDLGYLGFITHPNVLYTTDL
jgi:hypothetical protein